MKKLYTALFCLICTIIFSQRLMVPPSAGVDASKAKLISEFSKSSNYEQSVQKFVNDYLFKNTDKRVGDTLIKNISAEEKQFVKVNFDYKMMALYILNSELVNVEDEKIKKLTAFYNSVSGNLQKDNSLFLINYYSAKIIIDNIEMYIDFSRNEK